MARFAANLTLLFNEIPMMQRFGAAKRAGFQGVEILFPYGLPIEDPAPHAAPGWRSC